GGYASQTDYEAKADVLTDELYKVFEAAGTNCDKLAQGLNQFIDKNAAAIQGSKEFEKANPGVKQALADKNKDRQQRFSAKLAPMMQTCQKHRGLRDALSRLSD